jgi:hypothetical protein
LFLSINPEVDALTTPEEMGHQKQGFSLSVQHQKRKVPESQKTLVKYLSSNLDFSVSSLAP